MKKLFALMLGLLSCTLLLCLSVNAVELYVDTELVQTDVPPQLVSGRTLVPMRAIFEYLGAEVTWDNDTRTATGTLNDTVVTIQIDNTTAYVNGVPYTLYVPAQIIGNRTMVPARFDIRTGSPSLTRLTSCPIRICRFSPGLSPKAAHMAIMRPM